MDGFGVTKVITMDDVRCPGDMRRQVISCQCIDYLVWLCVCAILYSYSKDGLLINNIYIYNHLDIIKGCVLIKKWFSCLTYHEIFWTWSPFGKFLSWHPLRLLHLVSSNFLKHAPLVVGDMTFLLLLISPWTKWPPSHRRHFQMHFREWNELHFD